MESDTWEQGCWLTSPFLRKWNAHVVVIDSDVIQSFPDPLKNFWRDRSHVIRSSRRLLPFVFTSELPVNQRCSDTCTGGCHVNMMSYSMPLTLLCFYLNGKEILNMKINLCNSLLMEQQISTAAFHVCRKQTCYRKRDAAVIKNRWTGAQHNASHTGRLVQHSRQILINIQSTKTWSTCRSTVFITQRQKY